MCYYGYLDKASAETDYDNLKQVPCAEACHGYINGDYDEDKEV